MDWQAMGKSNVLSLPDRLSIDLERLILDGTLAPGDRLPSERELAEHLGVSRVSIRQALHELESGGLIDRKPGRGTIVLSPGKAREVDGQGFDLTAHPDTTLEQIMELRAIIEPPAARLTASRATARDIEQLRELVVEMEGDVSKERYAQLDAAFHQAIAQYTHNPLISLLNEQIATHIAPGRASRYQTRKRRNASSKAHRRIYEAIAAGDGDLAEYEARQHVIVIRQLITDVD